MKIVLLTALLISSCAHDPKTSQAPTKYSRKEWKHWTDHDRNCLDMRHEILKTRSLTPPSLNARGCKVLRGQWEDYYFPKNLSIASNVDIDHLVPLKNAHESGGYAWSKRQRETFANDPRVLVITDLKYNRQKGSKGIDRWLPAQKSYACKYVKDWIRVKREYRLHLLEAEKQTITQISPECKKLGYTW
jgi:hypothetical protein